jgi:hypothetical protein
MTPNAPNTGQTAAAKVRLPDHVVFRRFAAETVVLNITTGKYHGLNPTAGRMLELLAAADSVSEAAGQMAEEYGRPVDEIERDMNTFCEGLLERGLIEVEQQS